MKHYFQKQTFFLVILLMLPASLTALITTDAYAQDRNNAWQFKGQNRASIAALIRDVEENGRGSAGVAIAPMGGYTNLVCGKDGQTSAAANTTCVILNNSSGTVGIGQDATGNQTASTNTESHESMADAVLETLTQQIE